MPRSINARLRSRRRAFTGIEHREAAHSLEAFVQSLPIGAPRPSFEADAEIDQCALAVSPPSLHGH